MNRIEIESVVPPYTAITISIVARFIFLYLLYKNKSQNNYSLVFCLLNIGASSIWMFHGVRQKDAALLTRSATEIVLLMTSVLYILRNKMRPVITPAQLPTDPPAASSS
jgi:hypothetical protein